MDVQVNKVRHESTPSGSQHGFARYRKVDVERTRSFSIRKGGEKWRDLSLVDSRLVDNMDCRDWSM